MQWMRSTATIATLVAATTGCAMRVQGIVTSADLPLRAFAGRFRSDIGSRAGSDGQP